MNTHDDLGDSLKITKTEGRQLNAPSTWVSASIAGHTFQVVVFEGHAENEEYELGTSRISKLRLRRQAKRPMLEATFAVVAFMATGGHVKLRHAPAPEVLLIARKAQNHVTRAPPTLTCQ